MCTIFFSACIRVVWSRKNACILAPGDVDKSAASSRIVTDVDWSEASCALLIRRRQSVMWSHVFGAASYNGKFLEREQQQDGESPAEAVHGETIETS